MVNASKLKKDSSLLSKVRTSISYFKFSLINFKAVNVTNHSFLVLQDFQISFIYFTLTSNPNSHILSIAIFLSLSETLSLSLCSKTSIFFLFLFCDDNWPVGNVYNCKSNMKNELYFWLQKASSLINKVQTRFTDDDIMSHSWFCSHHSIRVRVKGNRIWVGFVKRSTIFSRITLICSMNSSALFQIRFLLKPLPISHVLLTCKLCPSKEILCSRRFKAVYVGRIIITTTFWSVFTATLLDI